MGRVVLAVCALLLSACAIPASDQARPAPAPAGASDSARPVGANPRPSVAVLGVKLAHPSRPPSTRQVSTPRAVPRTTQSPAARTKTTGKGTCVVGQPCTLPGLTWTKTYGCTATWRKATGLQCPPGWPALP